MIFGNSRFVGIATLLFCNVAICAPSAAQNSLSNTTACMGADDPLDGILRTEKRRHPNGKTISAYIIALDKPSCVLDDDGAKRLRQKEIHVAPREGDSFSPFVGKRVKIKGPPPFEAHTAYHFRELVKIDTYIVRDDNRSDTAIYYVANTEPPDAFLALRTDPTSSVGQRIMAMVNGTQLQVLQRREDGWWYVRVLPSGQEGWALSGRGNTAWIVCCATAGAAKEEPSAEQTIRGFSCDQLWFGRNSVFKVSGYCFKSPRAIREFGNAGCRHDNEDEVPLSQPNRNLVEAIREAERSKQCPR